MAAKWYVNIETDPICHQWTPLVKYRAMIHKKVLPNGIPVFVVESHASPVVSIHAVVTRGSIHESNQLAGISHFLEHSLFKGTKRRKVGQIALEIESHGGEVNAFTSFSETAYYTTIASRYFEEGLDVISDAIQNPSFDPEEMEKEKEVILEEIKRANDSPHRVLSYNLWKSVFFGTPYGRPVLGYESTVKKINAKTLSSYFKKQYHAGTISLFVVGDVDLSTAHSSAARRMSKIKRQATMKVGPFRFPKISSAKIITAGKEIEETHLQIGFRVPGIHDADTPILDLMCAAVGQGESSRLYQRLVKETQLALDAQIGLMATGHCGLVLANLTVAPEKAIPAIQETYKLLTEVAKEGLNDDEVDRIKNSLESDTTFAKETVEGFARRLGYYYAEFGNPEYESTYLDELMSVTPIEASRAISSVFQGVPILSCVHPNNAKIDEKSLESILNKGFTPSAHPVSATTPLQKTTRGSITFITKKTVQLPTLSIRLICPGGSRAETLTQQGLGNLFSRVWSSGTTKYKSVEIARTLESLGASINTSCGRNTTGLAIECLTKHWHFVRPIFHEILNHPTFPEDEFNTERALLLREILSERDSPGTVVHLGLMERLFPNHPYGRSSLGRRETVEKLTRDDCVKFYRTQLHQNKLVVSTVGDFRKEINSDLAELCSHLPIAGGAEPGSNLIKTPERLSAITAKKSPLHQCHIMVGFIAASMHNPDRYALKLLSSALSGQGGRLFLELRDKESLAYSVSPMQSDGPDAGTFSFYIGCSPEKWQRALQGIRREIEKVIHQPLGKTELARAKQYWLGRFDLDMQRASSQCFTFGLDEVYGLGFEHSQHVSEIIQAIDAKRLQEVAAKYLNPRIATISIIHSEALTEEMVVSSWIGRSEVKSNPTRVMEAM